MENKKLDGLKLGLEFFMGAGTDRIVAQIIKANVPTGNKFQQVAVFTARLGIGMAVSQAVTRVVNKNIDDIATAVEKSRAEIKASKPSNTETTTE
jgi:hypothetical protein